MEIKEVAEFLQGEFPFRKEQIISALELKEDGNTIPFIARYRKEKTGGLLDEELRSLFLKADYFNSLEERKQDVLRSIEEQGALTEELIIEIAACTTLVSVEDIYRPYKKKKNTRGSLAKEAGLDPLAQLLLDTKQSRENLLGSFSKYLNPEKSIETEDLVLKGAQDILAEAMSDCKDVREYVRRNGFHKGILKVSLKKEDDQNKKETQVYQMYFDYQEPVRQVKNHRVLAILRGEKEGLLKVRIEFPEEEIASFLGEYYQTASLALGDEVLEALKDGLKRLLLPSVERELLRELKEKSELGAISLFKENLKQLLLTPPVKGKNILGFDPAFRTGCKLAVLDASGNVLDTAIIFPTEPRNQIKESKEKVLELIKKHDVTAIALGNGTASRESETFLVEVLREQDDVAYTIVSEAGASVYSASKVAIKEFPEMDVTLRSAVSIGRRVLDPLAELVKIESKAIGVGQYQHDVNQKLLQEALDGVVEACVNYVGVDVNTASVELLAYVAGINLKTAENIYAYRQEHGSFASRKEFLKVKGLGPKAFLQGAGFLRIKDGENILDNTSVHPESYALATKILNGETVASEDLEATIEDIKKELEKPGREVRENLTPPVFKRDVLDFKDLKVGQVLEGIVRNIVDFGVFVDLGVHHDGLIHISELKDGFVKHPFDVVSIGQTVKARIITLDQERQRIGLSLRSENNG